MVTRGLVDALQKSKKSVLLLGPRQTGKSTLIQSLSPNLTINLANESTYLEFSRNPRELEERLEAKRPSTVFIDEVQRLPSLLNTVQSLLDEKKTSLKFYLTGSSARKLKRGKANLLPGRIHSYYLGPLTCFELGYDVDVKKAMSTGTLPGIWTEPDLHEREKTLRSYAGTYLKEEIQAEALTQNIEGFSRFLFVAAAATGSFLDFSKLASQAQVPRQSAIRYFEILEDTLVLHRCESFRKSQTRRLVQSPRYYFFDPGVLNGLLGNFEVSLDRVGLLFEHLIFNQLVHSSFARDREIRISTYRTEHGAEVDFILETGKKIYAIEVKASWNVGVNDLRGFKSFTEYFGRGFESIVVYLGHTPKTIQNVRILPWQEFFREVGL